LPWPGAAAILDRAGREAEMAPTKRMTILALAAAAASCSTPAPEKAPHRDTLYFYYLHGRIVEDEGPRGVSPRHGAYDYPGIVQALRAAGLEVISEIRPRGTDPSTYADKVVADIRARLAAGVPAAHITVAGASKGSVIASLVSTRLGEPGVRYVLLANCNDWLVREIDPRLTGEILSIYEASDDIGGTCRPVVDRSPEVKRFEELRLDTGLGHGIVYRPLKEWTAPAIAWAKR
jgi:hypothetical protein